MSDSKFRLAVCQLRTRREKSDTLIRAEEMIREAALNGASVVVLPEMFTSLCSHEYFGQYAEPGNGETFQSLSRWAAEYNVIVIGGSIPETEQGKLFNSSYVFDRNGDLLARHRKVHMFDIDLKDQFTFNESDSFTAGDDYCVFDTELGRFGVAICFDIRFPEYIRGLARRGAELILLPAQFTVPTGEKHWDLMTRARAVDNEVRVVGAEAARDPDGPFQCWGHSIIVSPYGEIIAQANEQEQILYGDIDLNQVERVRSQLPTFLKLRDDLYPVNDGYPME